MTTAAIVAFAWALVAYVLTADTLTATIAAILAFVVMAVISKEDHPRTH